MRENIREHHGHREWRGGEGRPGHGFWFGAFGPGAQQRRHRWHGHGRGPGHGHGHGRGPGAEWREFFREGGAPWEGGPWGNWFGGPGGPGGRERLERGTLRFVIMDVLKDGPKHGYEIIKELEERTQGRYSPSPGTLYPTLQLLEDQGIVRSEQESDRRVYHLTESGRAELDKNAGLVEGFWSRFQDRTPPIGNMYELKFAADTLKDLLQTVGMGLRTGAFSGDPEKVRQVRQALERCRNEIREIIARGPATRPSSGQTEGGSTNSEGEGEGTVRL